MIIHDFFKEERFFWDTQLLATDISNNVLEKAISDMRLKKVGTRYQVKCFHGDKVNGHCPSVDVLFESVANVASQSAIGVILTGMGYDGAKGLLEMRKGGAKTLGQDEASAVVYGMPKVAYNIGAVEKQASLERIPHLICKLLNE